MRRRLGNAFPDSAGGERPLYLRRGGSGVSRLVANEDQVVAALETRGFDLLDLEGASVRDLFRRTRDAKFVVSMDGSHLNHTAQLMI